MKLKSYFFSMQREDQDEYALRAGTTGNYIRTHLMAEPPRKIPRPDLMQSLAEASGGQVTHQDVLKHFYNSKAA